MRCVSPIQMGSNVIPCGKCGLCLSVKRQEWTFRLEEEQKVSYSARFLTITYEDDKLPRHEESGQTQLVKRDMQLFMKKLRKFNTKFSPYPVRFYTVGEYGTTTSRPHYHSIIFNLAERTVERLDSIWQKGFVHVGEVTTESIAYVTKYVVNKPEGFAASVYFDSSGARQFSREPPFALMSRRPGIGANYLATHTEWHRIDMRAYAQTNGVKKRLPRYYKDKIFNEDERRELLLKYKEDSAKQFVKKVKKSRKTVQEYSKVLCENVSYEDQHIKSKINNLNKI